LYTVTTIFPVHGSRLISRPTMSNYCLQLNRWNCKSENV